jgi:biopolymer transport protein TolQ
MSWTIIFKKHKFYKEVERQSLEFHEEFQKQSSLSEIYRECERYPMSPLAGISGLERMLKKAAMAEMMGMERSLSWLATTGAVTPFIGLFGTVVGIINAFQGLGEGSTTTIQAVAPGISEALVATAAGLFAAIPAVIGYNHFISRLRQFGAEMDDFSVELLNLIERSFG